MLSVNSLDAYTSMPNLPTTFSKTTRSSMPPQMSLAKSGQLLHTNKAFRIPYKLIVKGHENRNETDDSSQIFATPRRSSTNKSNVEITQLTLQLRKFNAIQSKIDYKDIDTKIIISFQSIIRGYLTRRVFGLKLMIKRKAALMEFLTTEESYSNRMNEVCKKIYKPLLTLSKNNRLLVEKAFSVYQEINENSQMFCNIMNNAMKNYTVFKNVSCHLLECVEYLSPYMIYVIDNENSIKAEKELEKLSITTQVLSIVNEGKLQNRRLSGLLQEPSMRVMQYPMLIKEALKYTHPKHPDYSALKEAYKIYYFFTTLINSRCKQKDLLNEWANLTNQPEINIKGRFCLGVFDLIPNGMVRRKSYKKMLVCNDIIFIVVDNSKKSFIDLTEPQNSFTIEQSLKINDTTTVQLKHPDILEITTNSELISKKFMKTEERDEAMKQIETSVSDTFFDLTNTKQWITLFSRINKKFGNQL
ncbi:hypothetical protein, conserved [Entamoeba dispar SAW760]|uniref:DH domain-containing protein n=1 Tax=Entamoeba dispar (strain ATCC PRA-260 / SAW760) TaxID=370354 RepID=B0EMY0_ENTDS|nr:uncharacterized protein EDI_198930 [Entamoeba dispar SAW760]EDR24104.1 hypothetical protein, conserved [Entamoeba dispar SAW760]|eukprot:EDR24104.1 hypothetical protein, conserved [Entamoeba dispar SAW760]